MHPEQSAIQREIAHGTDVAEGFTSRIVSKRRGERYAATGLAAAWLLTKWAGFRTVTVYIDKAPDADLRKRLGFREDGLGQTSGSPFPTTRACSPAPPNTTESAACIPFRPTST
jgi:hypothetical protein